MKESKTPNLAKKDSELMPAPVLPAEDGLQSRRVELVLFLMLVASYLYFLPRWADWSQDSRLDLTLAIVDQHTLSIDDYFENTGDYAVFNGRHYLDKAPGPSLLAVPIYAAMKPILRLHPMQDLLHRLASQPAFESTLREGGTGLLETKVYRAVVLYVLTAVLVAFPSALLGVLLFRVMGMFQISLGWRAAIVLLYGLATNAFPYAGAFYSHQLSAFLLFASFYLCFKPRPHDRSMWRRNLFIGLMIGLALISEYPTALIGGALAVLCVLRSRSRRELTGLVAGGLVPGVILAAYDWAIFGTILPVGYEYSALYQDLHNIGLISLTYPHPEAMWGITFGSYRGLFYVSPVLLLALWGYLSWARSGFGKSIFAVSVFSCLSFFFFNSSSAMWQGGYAVGPRYLVPMLPFMTLALAYLVRAHGAKRPFQWLVAGLGGVSMAVVWIESISGQGFPDWTPSPLWNYSLPHLLSGNIARNLGMVLKLQGWNSLIPLFALLLVGGLILSSLVRPIRGVVSLTTGKSASPIGAPE
ncbi:MAG: hypothetical protein WBZ24_14080 [Anaerolineales bacterium]|jgi:hypothetical protein